MSGRIRASIAVLLLNAFSAIVVAEEPVQAPPSWPALIAKGMAPYHKLTVSDFPINDAVQPKFAFYLKTSLAPNYRFMLKPYNGLAYAYVEQWQVFSGFNKNESFRKSAFKTMKAELPYVQALLDLSEIHARQLAALKTGELPQARGNSFEEARAELARLLEARVAATQQAGQVEMDVFAKATENGANKKKVRELAAEITRRLEATPATTVPFTEAPAGQAASPSPTPGALEIAPSPSPGR